jgi:hypothetical protein
MTDSGAAASFAVQRRRECRREEFTEQVKFAELPAVYLDPTCTFWTSLENKPLSPLSGIYQKRRGVRSGDVRVAGRTVRGSASAAAAGVKGGGHDTGVGKSRRAREAARLAGSVSCDFIPNRIPNRLNFAA